MQLIDKLKIVLFQPTSFFAHLKKEQGVKAAFTYFAVFSFIGILLAFLVAPISAPWQVSLAKLFGKQIITPTLGRRILSSLLNFIIGLGLSFVGAALLHIWIKLCGGRAPYAKTYQLSIYSTTPSYIFGWIPVLGLFSVIYNLVLLIIGTQQVHSLSKKRVLLMYLIPFVILLVLLLVIVGLGFYIVSVLGSLPIA